MSLLRRTVRAALWTVSTSQLNVALTLAGTLVVVRLVSPEELGLYALVTAIVGILSAASSLQAGGYYVVTTKPSDLLLRTGLTLELLLGFVLWLGLAIGAVVFVLLGGSAEVAGLLALAGVVFVTKSFTSLRSYYERQLEYRIPAIGQTISVALGVLVKIVLVAAGLGSLGLIVGDIVLTVVFAAYMLAFVPPGRGLYLRRDLVRRQLGFGIPTLGTGIFSAAIARVPELIVATVLGTRDLGFYYLASRIPNQALQVWRTFSNVLLPAFSRTEGASLERGFSMSVRFSAYLVAIPIAALTPIATPFIESVFGSVWSPAATPFALLLAAAAVRFVFLPALFLLTSRERVRVITALTGAQLAVTAIASSLGALGWGLVGVGAAILLVELIFALPKIRLARSVARVRFAGILTGPATVTAVGWGLMYAISTLRPDPLGYVAGLIAVTALVLSLVWFRDRDTLQAMLAAVRRGQPQVAVSQSEPGPVPAEGL